MKSITNSIICGDCQDKMRQHIPSESIDLVYLDPPFFSGKNYEVIWKDGAEVRSFEDTEFYTLKCECGKLFPENHLYCAFCGAGKNAAKEVRSNDMEAYLQWLRPKLEECYRVLKQTGTIYVHLDWHAVHYVKVIMDEIFGMNNFQNEIIWHYFMGGKAKKFFARKHDNILSYTKGRIHTFNPMKHTRRLDFKPSLKNTAKDADTGKDEFGYYSVVTMDDVWDIKSVFNMSNEYEGYPTQKPEALLERIIKASSNPGDIILDPFSGCATCISVAEKLKRRWIGIDVSPTSCRLMTNRLRKQGYSIGVSDIIDMPQTEDELRSLPPFEFQNWVVQQLGGRQFQKKTGDDGIDGWTFEGDPIQVKQSEKVGVNVVKMLTHDTLNVDKKKGIIVSFSYSKGAYAEVGRAKTKFGIDIELKTVAEMIE